MDVTHGMRPSHQLCRQLLTPLSQALYKHDWRNFLERMKIQDEVSIWSRSKIDELRRWASLRAQTLSRTVEGMMHYEKALHTLCEPEKIPIDKVHVFCTTTM